MNHIAVLASCLFFSIAVFSQSIPTRLNFEQGKKYEITMVSKTTIAQEAMGQSIDFNVDATGVHTYTVTNATDDNTTLHHEVNKVKFNFTGMGQKMAFDSENEKDLNGALGKPIKEMKVKTYDMIIDTIGIVKMAFPEKITIGAGDNRMAMVGNLMKEVMDIVEPPVKGQMSFFKILPGTVLKKGDTWTASNKNDDTKFNIAYSLTDITDSTILIDFVGSSVTVTKAEMMGNETTTTMNHKSTGKIILDKATGLIKEKTTNITSTGNTETSFGTLPVTSKATIVVTVK